ncbi:MAG: hypothetical protein JST84_06550 [Acidobacteria bacterium]|nr:hypothetical protein [Acidobacteriota bacterium]
MIRNDPAPEPAKKRTPSIILILLPWVSFPLFLSPFWWFWDQLPEKLVVQVDLSGTPSNSMGRFQMLGLGCIVLLFALTKFTTNLWLSDQAGGGSAINRGSLIFYYFVMVFLLGALLAVLFFNLK